MYMGGSGLLESGLMEVGHVMEETMYCYSGTWSCRGGQVFNLDILNEDLKKKKKKYHNSGNLNFVSVK